jgi:predicted CXXCH cytochrome family protein
VSRARRSAGFAAVLALLSATAGDAGGQERAGNAFPHAVHQRLFPVCEGCHLGVLTGRTAEIYPAAEQCSRCHDETRVRRTSWRPPVARASNLRFYHAGHPALAAGPGDPVACLSCHAAGGVRTPMAVASAGAAICLDCHAHAAETHLAASVDCSRCHVPLAEAVELAPERIAGFPRPASHERDDFLAAHAPGSARLQASCSVCHARESCARCHANEDRLPQVTALAPDPRVAGLVAGLAPRYPVPSSHRQQSWDHAHGSAARNERARCDNCHTRTLCTGCHVEPAGTSAAVIAALPASPAGVRTVGTGRTRTVHAPGVLSSHGGLAAAGALECTQCHTQRHCAECHKGSDSRAFHPSNFLERHSVDVFAAAGECQSCHSSETFCRACHSRLGVASQGRMDAAFHTGQRLWVLSHGQAARTGMESCVSCHRQNDCVQCHSAAGGWGVSPHGPSFAAARVGARNRATCRLCHLADPLERDGR